jgi:hypothetical protein
MRGKERLLVIALCGAASALLGCGLITTLAKASKCCCFPTTSTNSNDGRLVDPSECKDVDYYCAGNTVDNSGPERQAYAQHCGNIASMDLLLLPVPVPRPVRLLPMVMLARSENDDDLRTRFAVVNVGSHAKDVCTKKCDQHDPSCLEALFDPASEDMQNAVLGLRRLFSELTAPPTTISAARLGQMFRRPSDPCHRGSIVLKNGSLVNDATGKDASGCTITVPLSPSQATLSPVIEIDVPRSLTGRAEVTSTRDRLSLTFSDLTHAARLHFANSAWNDTFGGYITDAIATASRVVVTTSSGGCVTLSYGPETTTKKVAMSTFGRAPGE